jgi:hypothetical protein
MILAKKVTCLSSEGAGRALKKYIDRFKRFDYAGKKIEGQTLSWDLAYRISKGMPTHRL